MDFELHPDMDAENMPCPAPGAVYTDTSYLFHSSQSIALRIRLCAAMNSLRASSSFQDLLNDEQSILTALAKIPKWNEGHTLQTFALLDLQLRQFIVMLHTQRALSAQSKQNPEHRYSTMTALEASATLVERHSKLMDVNNWSLCCTRSDYVRAALLICHVAYHASLAGGEFSLDLQGLLAKLVL